MTALVENGVRHANGAGEGSELGLGFHAVSGNGAVSQKKLRESERRRRRRKQKKEKGNKNDSEATDAEDNGVGVADEGARQNDQGLEKVEVEYVPEATDIDNDFLDDFKKVFERFSFSEAGLVVEAGEKKDEAAQDAASKKKVDSDSDEDEQDAQQKERGVSNKKKKLQRRMKIAELKQICSKPDVVEIWDATAADPKLLVYLKSYRNTVPVPRHWCQKRKFLQADTDHQPYKPWSQELSLLTKGEPWWFLS